MPDPDWDNFAKLGKLRAVLDQNDKQGFKNHLIDHISWNSVKKKLGDSKNLLDFGCGTGRNAPRIADLGIQYTGIDSAVNMVKTAREVHSALEFNFIHFNGVDMPFADKSFDTCLSSYVFQYIMGSANTQDILAEIRRVLAPGGRLIMAEQASLSNQTSGTVIHVSTESDYVSELSTNFLVESVTRIRSGQLSSLSNRVFLIARYLPWIYSRSLNFLANKEIRRARNANDSYFLNVPYYDILIEAVAPK